MKVINLDKDIFERACFLCEKEFSYIEIIKILNSNNDVEKQIAILKLEDIKNFEDAKLLVSHLTGQDGPIREAVAVKLNELILQNKCDFLDNINFYEIFVDAVCDVNPNICRTIIDFLTCLKDQNSLFNLLINKIENIYERIDSPDVDQKNFLTVRLFNLYWCLEAIGEIFSTDDKLNSISNNANKEKLFPLLDKAIKFDNYTINEKVARIIVCNRFKNNNQDIVEKLKNTKNFYVQRYFS